MSILKIFRTFRKKNSRLFVKTFDKQKIFASVSVRIVHFARIESWISIFFDRFFEFATFSNFSSRFFVDMFFEIATFSDFSFAAFFDFLFLFDSFLNDFRDFFFSHRSRDFRLSKTFQKRFQVSFNFSINLKKENMRHFSNF